MHIYYSGYFSTMTPYDINNAKVITGLAKKRIAEFRYDHEHKEIKEVVSEAAEEQLNLINHSSPNSVFIGVEYRIFRYSFGVMPSYLLNILRNWV